MLSKTFSATVDGIRAIPVTIEVDSQRCSKDSTGRKVIVGLPDSSVRESCSRIEAAIKNSGYILPNQNITVNLSPGDIRKEGTGFDLPIALGILTANGFVTDQSIANRGKFMMVGELGLDGSIQPIRGVLPIAIQARSLAYDGLIVPFQNVNEAAVVNNIKVYGARTLQQVMDFFNGINDALTETVIDTRAEFAAAQQKSTLDFADVKGQENVKRVLEIAAAGGHNVIMVGPPGAGKSMMAQRLPSILPPLTMAESLATTQIHSVAGTLKGSSGLITERPFRSPHHTVSQVALVGGGANPMPGEISLAHNGVLFCDELPEFPRAALEVLRQPLEDRKITVARAKYTIEYPCNFMFVASMNPCPCGYYNHPTKACQCTPGQIHKYLNKISGPLLDRIDLQIEILPVSVEELTHMPQGEPSAVIRERVIRARKIQEERFRNAANANANAIHTNAQMTSAMMKQFAPLSEECLQFLRQAMTHLNLSARAYDRIVKVARTIADLAGVPDIQVPHIAEAVGYRSLDREHWGE